MDGAIKSFNFPPSGSDFDYIYRLTYDAETGYFMQVSAETATIANPIRKLMLENHDLKLIINNQWRSYNYCWEYNNYLLGNYTKEDFLAIARRYAQPFLRLPDNKIIELASLILQTIGETLNSGEIAQFLNLDPADIERVLQKYSPDKIAELPEE